MQLLSAYTEELSVTLQMVFISVGASRQQKKRDSLDTPSVLPPPPRESLPTLLLLQPQYFEQLFSLMQTLSSMKTPVKGGVSFVSSTLCSSVFEGKVISLIASCVCRMNLLTVSFYTVKI